MKYLSQFSNAIDITKKYTSNIIPEKSEQASDVI